MCVGGGGEECAAKHFRTHAFDTSLLTNKPKTSSCLPRESEVLFVVGIHTTQNEKMAVLRIYPTYVLVSYLIFTVSVQLTLKLPYYKFSMPELGIKSRVI